MTSPLPKDARAPRFVVPRANGDLHFIPERANTDLDALLQSEPAETLVCLPLYRPKKKNRRGLRRTPSDKALAKRRNKLQNGHAKANEHADKPHPWHDARLELDGPTDAIPSAYTFDLRRHEARTLAEELGLTHYYWSCHGGALETHEVAPFDDDEDFDLDAMRKASHAGRRDLARSIADWPQLAASLAFVGSSRARLLVTALIVIVTALAAFSATALGLVDPALDSEGSLTGAWRAIALLLHPLLLPPLALGFYLRHNLHGQGGAARRELSREEVDAAWRKSAPHLAAVWAIASSAVLLLSLTRLMLHDDLSVSEIVDSITVNGMIALWVLTPLTYSHDRASAIGSSFEAALRIVITIFVVKLTLAFTGFAMSLVWSFLTSIISISVPDWIKQPVDAATELGAGMFLLAILLGYTWAKAHDYFGRWATVTSVDDQ